MKARFLTSVVMPVYNERPLNLKRAIESVLDQSFSSFEFVVVDDGSTHEETKEMLSVYSKLDERLKLFRGRNRGVARALNIGMRLSQAEIIFRHDSDDWSEANRFSIQFDFMRANPKLALVGSNVSLHQEDGSFLWNTNLPTESNDLLNAFPKGNPYFHGSVCFRRSKMLELGGYDISLDGAEDYDIFWRMTSKWGGANLPNVLYHHRRSSYSVSVVKYVQQSTNALKTRASAGAAVISHLHHTRDGQLAALLQQGDNNLLAGRYRSALTAYTETIKHNSMTLSPYLKIIRLLLFLALPFPQVRRALFRRLQ